MPSAPNFRSVRLDLTEPSDLSRQMVTAGADEKRDRMPLTTFAGSDSCTHGCTGHEYTINVLKLRFQNGHRTRTSCHSWTSKVLVRPIPTALPSQSTGFPATMNKIPFRTMKSRTMQGQTSRLHQAHPATTPRTLSFAVNVKSQRMSSRSMTIPLSIHGHSALGSSGLVYLPSVAPWVCLFPF